MLSTASPDCRCRVCVLTPPGRAAVASIFVEGAEAESAVDRFFQPASGRPLSDAPLRRPVYGQWTGGEGNNNPSPGEGVVVCRISPQQVEIHCHGGKAAVAAVVETLVAHGCREVDWREWAKSAEEDALAAEARIALAEARTRRAAGILLDQYRGALRRVVEAVIVDLEAERREQARHRLDDLLRHAKLGLHLTRPWRIVLAGRPNVGKSSLINALVGYRRAIVHDTPGVTRDVLTAPAALDGWPVELTDTAGVRESDDALEAAGVAKTRQELQTADVVALVFDATRPWSPDDEALRAAAPGAILVHNKCDLARDGRGRPGGLATSAVTGAGIQELTQAMVARLAPHSPLPGAAVPFTRRQIAAFRDALRHIEANDLAAGADSLRAMLVF